MLRLTITAADRELLASVDETLDNAIWERMGRIEPAKLRTFVKLMERLRAES